MAIESVIPSPTGKLDSVAIFNLPTVATSASRVGVFKRLAMREPEKEASVPVILPLIIILPLSETMSREFKILTVPIPEGWINNSLAVVSIILSFIAIWPIAKVSVT